jgi:DNA-binding NtrC family response regulator
LSRTSEATAVFVGADAAQGAALMRAELSRLRMAVRALDLSGWADYRTHLRAEVIFCGTSSGRNSEALSELQLVSRQAAGRTIVFYTSASSEDVAISALRLRASEYLHLPLRPDEFRAAMQRVQCAAAEDRSAAGRPVLIGNSQRMQEVRDYIQRVARMDSNLLISGATGTGKELVAQLVHLNSARAAKPMVSVNCAAIPDSLLESELFGYERGAFTGAAARTEGKLRQAHTGTIFLDEIGDMSPCAQAKVLRAVEQKRIQRLGGNSDVEVDVRIIVATHQDLERLAGEGKFRADLYFRLSVGRLELPPLSERKEDIRELVAHAVFEFNLRFGRNVRGVTEEALEYFMRYDWPGNVRELRNVLEACFITVRGPEIGLQDFPPYFRNRCENREQIKSPQTDADRDKVIRALMSTNWNRSEAARTLHWSRMTLYRKMVRYRIGPSARVTVPRAHASV